MNRIHLGISGYYGGIYAYEENGKFYLIADGMSSDDDDIITISEEFYRAIQKEFIDET